MSFASLRDKEVEGDEQVLAELWAPRRTLTAGDDAEKVEGEVTAAAIAMMTLMKQENLLGSQTNGPNTCCGCRTLTCSPDSSLTHNVRVRCCSCVNLP